MGHVTGFAGFMGSGVRFALGMLAAMLPRRLWPSLDLYLPVSSAAAASGGATLLLAAAIGIPGFLSYAGHTASAHNAAALRGAETNDSGFDNEGALRRGPMAMNMLALPMFLFLTSAGWATMYLGTTGALRLGSAMLDEGFGDPLITAIDALGRRAARGSRARAAQLSREALEGPEMPDRIMSAKALGVAGDFVVVSSRRKIAWEKGTVVITPDGTAYRIGVVEDRTIAGRLRTLYPLTLHEDLEAFRRMVRYELPPGRH
jgi:hypothetical protein